MTIAPANPELLQQARAGLRLRLAYSGHSDSDPTAPLDGLPATLELFATAAIAQASGRGERLPLDGYARWLGYLQRRPVVYTNLLVPGDPEATWQHQQRLEAHGLQPIPVLEVGQDPGVLLRYLDAGHHYLALSPPVRPGWVRWELATALPWMRCCFQVAGAGVGFHLLEATSWALLVALPWSSADVQGWADSLDREELSWFDPEQGCLRRVPLAKSDGRRLLAEYGTDPALAPAYDRRAILARLAARAWQAAEAWLGDQFGPVAISGVDQAGPRLYLDSLGGVHLAHRGLSRLAAAAADVQAHPPAPTSTVDAEPEGLPAVVAALDAGQQAWLRDALAFLDRHGIDLVAGDFACRGFLRDGQRPRCLGRWCWSVTTSFPSTTPSSSTSAIPPCGWEPGWQPGSANTPPRPTCVPGTRSSASAAAKRCVGCWTPPPRRTPSNPPEGRQSAPWRFGPGRQNPRPDASSR